MAISDPDTRRPTALIIGASRGLGRAIAAELIGRAWDVIATVRDPDAHTPLHELAEVSGAHLRIERLDITEPNELRELRECLSGRRLDILFVNAGTAGDVRTPIGEVTDEEFIEVMITNALAPLRVIEELQDLVTPTGLIGAMSSGQGSITNNTTGLRELYRASKAALNMLMRSFAARQSETSRSLILMAPGWIRTDLGGADAPYTIEENVPKIVDVLLAKIDRPGLEYLDFRGATVPW